MRISATIRGGLLAAIAVSGTVAAQTLPPTATTTVPATAQAVTAPQQALKAAAQPAQRAQVKYETGLLSISADNSSLNQILREIGRLTGMKITGGVTDERVYGSYGPDDTSSVLSSLLKGTGSNMMLVLDAREAPKELVLTPRQGGPTPPNPNAAREREQEDLPPQRMPRVRGVEGVNQPPPFRPPQAQTAQPLPTQMEGAPPPPAPPTSDTTQQSPNGVKTPQEIYDQLMKLQQQQQQKPATPPQQ